MRIIFGKQRFNLCGDMGVDHFPSEFCGYYSSRHYAFVQQIGNPTTPRQAAFNNLLKQERIIIKRCFGQLEQRFPVLQNTIRISLQFIPMFIVACFVLHNVAKYLKNDAVMEGGNIQEEGNRNDLDDRNDDPAREEQRREGEMADIIFENII
ncbi:hypothetical protein ILUMI_09923 [Ignelater luminosus]|uniref:DDE Tnp4 domain-containing protein n=1 Tax=Ignelater luminosus TaxID=2038154 RepID=A0A8K0D3C1_IGNLU|nr:hypothetical protein ILUMI_09923 [Ignelater luminosus]